MSMREAQHTIYGYFNETLRALPGNINLSNRPDNDRLAVKGNNRALAIPCWDGSIQSHGPRQVSIGYWIVGVPSGGTREYFQRIVDFWRTKGWGQSYGDETAVAVRSSDGFGLKVQDAGKGDGSLSLTGFSPCVPEETKDSLADLPEVFPTP